MTAVIRVVVLCCSTALLWCEVAVPLSRLVLSEALPSSDGRRHYDLIVSYCASGPPRLAPVWAADSGLSNVLHTARVVQGDNRWAIDIELGFDPYRRLRGEGHFEVDLLAGRYTGRVQYAGQTGADGDSGQEVAGTAELTEGPSPFTIVAPATAIDADQPRLFGPLDRLRARSATPWGSGLREQLRAAALAIDLDAVDHQQRLAQDRERGPAMLAATCATAALIEDDPALARKAWTILQRAALVAPAGAPWHRHREDIHLGPVLTALAMTYDAGRAWWEPSERAAFRDALATGVDLLWTATIDGRHMGGTNLAPWSNRNAIRVAGTAVACLALLGDLPDDHPLHERLPHLLTHCGVSLSRYLHEGSGDSGICLEGHYYKHMVWRRALTMALLGYREALGVALAPSGTTRHMLVGEWLVPDIDHHSDLGRRDAFWPALWLTADEGDHGWLWSRFLARDAATRIGPGLLLATLVAVPEGLPPSVAAGELPWMVLDGRKGCHLFRPRPGGALDPALVLHQKRDHRRSCHYERFGIAPGLFWFGHDRRWFAGHFVPQPLDGSGTRNGMIGPVALRAPKVEDRRATFALDLRPELWQLISAKKTAARQQAIDGGASPIDQPYWGETLFDHGWRCRRDLLVDGSGIAGMPLVVVCVDRFGRGDPDDPAAPVHPVPAQLTFPFLTDGLSAERDGARVGYRDSQGRTLSAWALAPAAWRSDQPAPGLESEDGVFISVLGMHGSEVPTVALQSHDEAGVVVTIDGTRLQLDLTD